MWLTLREVAGRLKMPVETVHRWALQGKIPMHMVQGEYAIRNEMFGRWAAEHMIKINSPCPTAKDIQEPQFDGIFNAMQRGGVFYDLECDTKTEALRSAAARLPNILPEDRAHICEKLIERECLATTGIGHGIALPHPRANTGIKITLPQISTCFLSHPIAFDAIDQQPVSVLMVLLSGSTQVHLTLMSRLSFYLRDQAFRHHLLSVPPEQVLLDRVADLETNGQASG